MSYLFYAYKPDSDDYCKGFHMASYYGDVVFQPEIDEAEVVQLWAGCLLKNKSLETNEAGYEEITVLLDGRTLRSLEYDYDNIDLYNQFKMAIYDMERLANEQADKDLAEIKAKELAEKEKQKLADKARQEAYERKQLELLKKKFEQNS
jgi:hypothetical protein